MLFRSPIWKIAFPATYRQGVDSDTGPRCVPQFTSDAVLAYSAAGTLHCVELGTGKKRWSRELRKEYRAEDGYFGAGSTPLLVDSMAIVNVGGKKGGGVVAVSLADGKTIWAATDAEASYASPILWSNERNSVADSSSRTVVVPTRLATYGLDPKTGAVRWQFPFGQRGPTVNAATPIITADNNLFLTASYGIGFSIAKPSLDKVEVIQKGEGIASQYATPIAVGDTVFGSDGREDGGWPNFNCIDIQTGKTVWSQPNMQICHIIGIRQGGAEARLLLIGIDGKMWYLPASREGFKPLWSTELPSGKYRALPALSKNLLVVRTSGGSNTLWRCFEL